MLCVQNYIGYGYNEEFSLHMDDITKKLAEDPKVVIHEGCDDICTACPHKKDGTCTSLDKVDRMDSRTLYVCGLKYSEKRKWKDLKRGIISEDGLYDLLERYRSLCKKE